MQTENDPIGQYVRTAESDFTSGGGTLTSKYVTTDLYEDINKTYAYLESKHTSGETDHMGREKPFFNIVIAARNIWYRATDIDRKNIQITPTKSSMVGAAFVATVLLHNWMRKENFGAFLNDWGMELAGFNSAVVKFIEAEGELHPMVVPWSRLICDVVDFANNPKIEILELTEAQLYQRKGYNHEMIEKLCEALTARTTTGNDQKDNKSNYIKLYEVHGLFPLSYLTGKAKDEDEYAQQMHVISFVASKEKGKFDDFTLYSGREKEDPYTLTCLLPNTDGSISLNGSVKTLFEAQWMMNHTVKSIKDQLDVASKLIFQTSDGAFVGRNVLSAIEQGDILIHKVNEPLTQINNGSHDISSQQNYGSMWKSLSNEITGVSESMLGNIAPSGTAWRQVEALLNESHSLFELMTENKGLHIEDMLRKRVIPFLKKQMDTVDEVSAVLEQHNIKKIESIYLPKEAIRRYNKDFKDKLLRGELPDEFNPEEAQVEVQKELSQFGNQRFFVPSEIAETTWEQALEGLEWEVEVEVTGESSDKGVILTTLNTALATVGNPNYANNPQAQLIVSKILSATGVVSPLEIASLPAPTAPVAAPPVGGTLPVAAK